MRPIASLSKGVRRRQRFRCNDVGNRNIIKSRLKVIDQGEFYCEARLVRASHFWFDVRTIGLCLFIAFTLAGRVIWRIPYRAKWRTEKQGERL